MVDVQVHKHLELLSDTIREGDEKMLPASYYEGLDGGGSGIHYSLKI